MPGSCQTYSQRWAKTQLVHRQQIGHIRESIAYSYSSATLRSSCCSDGPVPPLVIADKESSVLMAHTELGKTPDHVSLRRCALAPPPIHEVGALFYRGGGTSPAGPDLDGALLEQSANF